MKKGIFLQELFEMLEISSVASLTEETILKELEEYDSMSILAIIALIDEKFNVQLTAVQLACVTTIGSLIKLVGLEKFEE